MKRSWSSPKLAKQLVLAHDDYRVYCVDPLAARDISLGDEEFGNFATHEDFPRMIPRREIWVSSKVIDREGIFFIADALTRLEEEKRGVPPDRACEAGQNVERYLRHRLLNVEFRGGKPHKRVPERIYVERYCTLPDEKRPIHVWLVDARLVRSFYKTDYTEGGHGYVYPWVPKDQIWIESTLDRPEYPFIVSHEYTELRLMRDRKMEYDDAHAMCSSMEWALHERRQVLALLAPGRRKLSKTDLPRLTRPEFFAYVVKHYGKRQS
jgi:hypothetical protein